MGSSSRFVSTVRVDTVGSWARAVWSARVDGWVCATQGRIGRCDSVGKSCLVGVDEHLGRCDLRAAM